MGSVGDHNTITLLEGEIRVWIEQESYHLVAGDARHGDPSELTPADAKQLAAALIDLAAKIDPG